MDLCLRNVLDLLMVVGGLAGVTEYQLTFQTSASDIIVSRVFEIVHGTADASVLDDSVGKKITHILDLNICITYNDILWNIRRVQLPIVLVA